MQRIYDDLVKMHREIEIHLLVSSFADGNLRQLKIACSSPSSHKSGSRSNDSFVKILGNQGIVARERYRRHNNFVHLLAVEIEDEEVACRGELDCPDEDCTDPVSREIMRDNDNGITDREKDREKDRQKTRKSYRLSRSFLERSIAGGPIVSIPRTVCLVMHYCEGGDLEKMLALRRRLSEGETRLVAQQLMSALDHMHNTLGILHGDVKCSNVVFALTPECIFPSTQRTEELSKCDESVFCMGEDSCLGGESSSEPVLKCRMGRSSSEADFTSGNLFGYATDQDTTSATAMPLFKTPLGLTLKLCDFGASRYLPNDSQTSTSTSTSTSGPGLLPYEPIGTEGYLGPELVLRQGFSSGVDMWAAGALLYKCLSGRLPFIPSRQVLAQKHKYI